MEQEEADLIMAENPEIDEKLKRIIGQAARLGWVQKMDGEIYIHLADVEKIIYGLMDENYGRQIDIWVKQSGLENETKVKHPELKPRDYDVLKENVKLQAEILRGIIKGEKCLFKEGCCPFNKHPEVVDNK